MRKLRARLHRLKLILTSVLLGVFGVGFIIVGEADTPPLRWLPWAELGGILLGAGLLGIWVDQFFQRDQQALADDRFRAMLDEHAPVMRDAVLAAFAAGHEDLARVATPDTLDGIATNALALRLDDERFAGEVYDDIRRQAVEAPERWTDATLDITLNRVPKAKGSPDFFSVTIRWEYSTVPHHRSRRFVALSDRRQYAEMAQDHAGTSLWYLKPNGRFEATDRAAFELVNLSVDGEPRTIRRTTRAHYQAYEALLDPAHLETGEPVVISYTYRTVTPQAGHLLFFDFEAPTRDIRVRLDYTDTDIAAISAIDLVPSVRPTRIEHSHADLPERTLIVDIDGWLFPRAGVAFAWTLESETSR